MAKPIYKNLTFQVLTAITLGILVGHFKPDWGIALKPVGDGFIRLVKMVVGPIIFLTIVAGIATMGDLKKVGRVGLKALIYFEVVTTIALLIGLVVANIAKPGAEIYAKHDQTALAQSNVGQVDKYTQAAAKGGHSFSEFILGVIPDNVVKAFADGNLLQILFFSVLCGCAVASLGTVRTRIITGLEHLTEVMFKVVALIMKVAPIGAFGAMGYTIGQYGLGSLVPLAKLMVCMYLTMAIFIFVVLWLICRLFRFSLFRYLAFIKDEILLVLGTSSSESALPRMIEKMERIGCGQAVVGMVIPAGYSFNLDGTSIYLSMAILFLAQAFGIDLSVGDQISIMVVLMLTSKGAAAVTGAGLVTLAATLDSIPHLPAASLALVIGVDRFMSEARAITNLIGNGVATICVSKWEGEFDQAKYEAATRKQPLPPHVTDASGFPVPVIPVDKV